MHRDESLICSSCTSHDWVIRRNVWCNSKVSVRTLKAIQTIW